MAPDTLSLAGKVAIVTGSGRESGIGAGIATALARNGAAVVLNFVSDATIPKATAVAEKLRNEHGARVATIQADIASAEGATKLAEETLKAFETKNIDILVNNAGCSLPGSTLETPWENVEKQFSINVYGAIHCVRAVVPHMPRGGRIINISSVASKICLPSVPFYNAAKAAMDSLTVTWAAEFGKSRGVTVNSLAPGPVETDESLKFRAAPGGREAQLDMIRRTRAADRMGEIEDVADSVLLLVQEKSRFITGQYIDVAGGITDF